MKSLKESLFDKDLVSSKLPFEKLLKSNFNIKDINELVFGFDSAASFNDVKNKQLKRWALNWIDENFDSLLSFCYYGHIDLWVKNIPENKEAESWLRFGEIHHDVHWNDAMYANDFDIPWGIWGKENEWDDITEWIMWKSSNKSYAMLLINRKSYNELDQQIIHKLIETANKKGTR